MKKKGFTLIELLAVIVILAIVALISTPTILGVIQKSKKASSEASAYGYIDAVEKYIMTNSMDMSKPNINNGIYKDNELDVNYKGKGPDNALVTVEKGIVKEAKLCINKYSFDYDGKEVTNSINNYCSNNYKIKLVIDDNIEEKSIEKETNTTFQVSDITNKTNIVCNNGAVPTIENNILTISNIFGDTTCKINNTLEDTINNIDNTENNIIMINDEEINSSLKINESNKVSINLNNYKLFSSKSSIFSVSGFLELNDNTRNSKIYLQSESGINGIVLNYSAKLIINYVDIEETTTTNKSNGIWFSKNCNNCSANIKYAKISIGNYAIGFYGSSTNSKLIINDGIYISKSKNSITNSGENNQVDINGGTFISNSTITFLNSSNGVININQTDRPIYITSLAQTWNPAIRNNSDGTINIKANQSDNCTNNPEDTKSGLCVYAEGDKDYTKNTSNGALQNQGTGVVNINGGTYYGGNQGINNNSGGTINIVNTVINSNRHAIVNNDIGIVNICSSNLKGYYDLNNYRNGTINYSSDIIFTNGTNTPNIYNPSGTINANYTGTCLSN